MPVVGIGVDIVDITRFERALIRTPALKNRLFGTLDLSRDLVSNSLAARFAAKEATIKALGGNIPGFSWHDVQVTGEHLKPPTLIFTGGMLAVLSERGISGHHLSLSHDAGMAIAFVVLEGENLR
jgi:holo-[acyl-carrier protein] synthase